MKKLFTFTALCALALGVASCEKDAAIETLKTPENLSHEAVTENSATISWQAVNGAEVYWIEVNDGDEIKTKNTTYELTGLDPETVYLWRVYAEKGNVRSEWSKSDAFATRAEAELPVIFEAPKNLAVTAGTVTANGATLTWTAIAGVSEYDVRIGTDIFHTSGATFTARELEPGTTYSWTVRAKSKNGISEWAAPEVEFVTLPATVAAPADNSLTS